MAASQPEAESAGQKWLNEALRDKTGRSEVADILLQAWWCSVQNKSLAEAVPDAAQRQAGWREAVNGKTVEIGWLARQSPRPARYHAPTRRSWDCRRKNRQLASTYEPHRRLGN